MLLFLDTADVDEIKEIASWGVLDGITTNPSLVGKTGKDFKTVVKEICQIVKGPVSAEVVSSETEGMVKEGRDIAQWAPNTVVKCPLTPAGLAATKVLAASIRTPVHVHKVALAGADICTMPYAIFKRLVKHPLTDKGLEQFLADWNKAKLEAAAKA